MKRLKRFVLCPTAGLAAIFLLVLWLGPLLRTSPELKEYRRMLGEAEELGLTYESALADPGSAAGKPVLWCVQNRGADMVTAGGDPGRRLRVVNHTEMPVFAGGKHFACTDMLLTVLGTSDGAVEVKFEYSRHI
ncbi:MAG: hypothetical protein FD189_1448 [Elusimicrobia bacterium]|nr:MAG: hypothetical protein FD154_10 [Elusimicrobiota bacterium]KAF0155339.1 MAG: hypothetical protein FD189_1448 [Elusimicrobiota bacterium]